MIDIDRVVNSGLFRYIDRSEHTLAFEQIGVVKKNFLKGETIYREGDVIDSLCIVSDGSVRSEKTYQNGEIHIVSVYSRDMIFGLEITVSQRKTTPFDFVANEDCEILFLPEVGLNNCRYSDSVRKAITEQLADDNIRMGHKIEMLAERGLRNRVMIYLDVLAQKANSNEVYVPMNREQLAQYLCVNRSALSNELNKMKREGIIDFKRHKFTLLEKNVK